MATFWERLKNIFSKKQPVVLREENIDSVAPKKKFVVQQSNRINQQQNKKFEVKEVKRVQIAQSNRGFSNGQISRPRKCPFCGTENTFNKMNIKSNNNYWECQKCGHKWRKK